MCQHSRGRSGATTATTARKEAKEGALLTAVSLLLLLLAGDSGLNIAGGCARVARGLARGKVRDETSVTAEAHSITAQG